MHNKRNVIVMFLLIMLSFAIITEVSAQGDAEIDGTGSDQSMISVDMPKHDDAGERFNENMQNHAEDDFQSHNEQKSFNKTPDNPGDNNRNENLYEHDMDLKPDGDRKPLDNMSGLFGPDGDRKPLDFNKSMENMTDFMFNDKPMGDLKNFTDNFIPDLRDDNFTDVPKNGELMNDVVSKLIGLNNITHDLKKDDKNSSLINKKPVGEKNDESAPQIPGDKKSSDVWSDNISKNTKNLKIVKKSGKKTKVVKKSAKKVKSSKKAKKTNKKLAKKSKKERAKL